MDLNRRRCTLRVADGNVAHLEFPDEEAIRVAIDSVSGASFNVQLNLRGVEIRVNGRYRVQFEARSDATRPVQVGVAEAHAPWTGLGLYRQFDLTPEWQPFESEFLGTSDERNARVHFDLAQSPAPVDIRRVTLLDLAEGGAGDVDDARRSHLALFGELGSVTPLSRNWGFERGQPIDRYYIEKFLARSAGDIQGRVLEIEDRVYTRQFGGTRVTASDVLHVAPGNPRATVVGDLANAPHLPSNTFDSIILTQTLQLIFDTRAALATVVRLLRPGGVLLATFPGLSKVSTQEWTGSWYWGFTTASARRLFEEAFSPGTVEVEAFGNVLSAIAFLHGVAAEELKREDLEYHDPEYELLLAVRARKSEASR